MNLIDWALDNSGASILYAPTSIIKEVQVIILDEGIKNWLETPMGTAEVEGMVPLIPETIQDVERAVWGYYAFGLQNTVYQDRYAWTPARHLNWKRNYFKPEISTASIRIWLREGVKAHAWIGLEDPRDVTYTWHAPVPPPN